MTLGKLSKMPLYLRLIVFVLVALCGVLILFSTWSTGFAMGYTDSAEVSGDDKLLLDFRFSGPSLGASFRF